MKANPNPRIKHVLKSGIVVEDISTVTIPKGHPAYEFLARMDRNSSTESDMQHSPQQSNDVPKFDSSKPLEDCLRNNRMKKRLTIKEAAQLMGAPEQFVRIALQQGKFTWGIAVKQSSRYTYYINAAKFYEEYGIEEESK